MFIPNYLVLVPFLLVTITGFLASFLMSGNVNPFNWGENHSFLSTIFLFLGAAGGVLTILVLLLLVIAGKIGKAKQEKEIGRAEMRWSATKASEPPIVNLQNNYYDQDPSGVGPRY
jgi:hypothetical protein